MNPKPQVSDEEIRSFMDFDGLLEQRNVVAQRKQLIRWSGAVIFALIIIVGAILFFPVERNSPQTALLTDSLLSHPQQKAQPAVSDADKVEGEADIKNPDAQVPVDNPEQKILNAPVPAKRVTEQLRPDLRLCPKPKIPHRRRRTSMYRLSLSTDMKPCSHFFEKIYDIQTRQ